MTGYHIRRMELHELKTVYRLMKKDFPRGEYAPYAILRHQLSKGIQEGWLYCEDDDTVAYAICAAAAENEHVLLSYMAVMRDRRGHGIGTGLLGALKEAYGNRRSMIVEVERPELAASSGERNERVRRIGFYEKSGYEPLTSVEYTIWDVPMLLMALPIAASVSEIRQDISEIMRRVYGSLMGEIFMHKLKIREIPE